MVARVATRITTMMNAGLTKDYLNDALGAFEKAGKELEIIWMQGSMSRLRIDLR